jgi:hypothetical protein
MKENACVRSPCPEVRLKRSWFLFPDFGTEIELYIHSSVLLSCIDARIGYAALTPHEGTLSISGLAPAQN